MKKIFVLGLSTVLALSAVTSCNDDDTPEPVRLPEKEVTPENGETTGAYISDLELTTYSPLKSYIDRAAYPNFKLTAAIEAADFNGNTNGTKDICVENFDEIVAGNAMKYASCVNAKGEMKFDDVKSFVSAAKDGGLSVFGHTLAWHSQQQPTYLNGLLVEEINDESSAKIMKVSTPKAGDKNYSWQIYYKLQNSLTKDETYVLTLKAKTDNPFKMGFWPYEKIDGGVTQYLADPEIGKEWKEYEWEFKASGNHTDLQFAIGFLNGDLFFDDVKLVLKGSNENLVGNGDFNTLDVTGWWKNGWHADLAFNAEYERKIVVDKSEDEQKTTLTSVMDSWIKGMMEATDGYVKAWDVVNEPIAGEGDDGEGNYPLQHAKNGNDDATSVKNGVFYWQDVLGDIDYVRTAVKSAREHFKGKAEDLKLFVNDYNLESDWDDNKKLKSLINWVKKWEADNVTRIDGLGTQMHISCYEDDATNDRKKAHIKAMFELMAATGKLVRISELDMGYVDKDDKKVATKNVTAAQHAKMAELYKFIVKTYLETIPAAQQYGICQWCLTDAPGELGTGWRGGEPVGLWTEKFEKRKATYAGFAEGLSGK